jgi:Transcriptional regulator
MLDTKHLQALAAVITEQSFEKAARTLFLTQSAVSQRIRQLENQVGQMLVVRSAPVRPTPAGMAMLRHFRQLAVLEESLFEELAPRESEEFVSVTLAVNADSLDTWFSRSVRDILTGEKVLLDLVVDDQSVTHAYLRSGEVQGAITSTPANFQGLVTHDLGDMEYLCVATPEFRRATALRGSTGKPQLGPDGHIQSQGRAAARIFEAALRRGDRTADACHAFQHQLPGPHPRGGRTAWSHASWPRRISNEAIWSISPPAKPCACPTSISAGACKAAYPGASPTS